MTLDSFKQQLQSLQNTLRIMQKEKIGLTTPQIAPGVFDYNKMRILGIQKAVPSYIQQLKKHSSVLINDVQGTALTSLIQLVNDLDLHYQTGAVKQLQNTVERIAELLAEIKEKPAPQKLIQIPQKIPHEIKDDLMADLHELEKVFHAGCYRSAVIMCGRILETTLHRKFFEVTGNDLLEKAPSIGLGKVIAKLKENEVVFDPGLTQQIHLINQVRIFSVHKKQEAFYPSKQQAQGTILLTMDVLEKFFGR